jgi:DNA-binding FadR family transcriptional regulator
MTNRPRFQAVERDAIYVQVADKIRQAILDRSIPAGEKLPPERELAAQFGVSRATIREALRHLQAQGLLGQEGRTSPMQATPDGVVVRFREALTNAVRMHDVSLPDLIELRLAVETAALTRASAKPRPEHIAEAKRQLAVMQDPEVDVDAFYHADVAFHVALVAASGNEALHLVMLAARDSIELHLDSALRARSFGKVRARLVDEHEKLLAAVERGRATQACSLVREHLTRFYGT